MDVWQTLLEITEADDFQDYDPTQAHPHLVKQREDMRKALAWVADGLDKHGTPEMKRVAQSLLKVPDLPSDQVLPTLKQAHDTLHKAKNVLGRGGRHDAQSKAIQDALMGIPSIMKSAGSLTKSTGTDQGLWQKKIKGYVDDRSGQFVRQGTTTYPTGQEPEKKSARGPMGLASRPPSVRAVPPMVRKKKEDESTWESLDRTLSEGPFGVGDTARAKGQAGGPKDDPLKDGTPGEHFSSDGGEYYIYRGQGGRYRGHFIGADGRAEPLPEAPNRSAAVEVILQHHDRLMAGV